MGFFSKVFENSLEKELEKKVVPMIMREGASRELAIDLFQKLLEETKNDIANSSPEQSNMGDIFWATKDSENTKSTMKKRLEAGATFEDIRAWWNLERLERELIKKYSDFQQETLISYFEEEEGLSRQEAWRKIQFTLPIYGARVSEETFLPWEIKWKVDAFLNELAVDTQNLPRYREEIAEAGSINAFVKQKLKL